MMDVQNGNMYKSAETEEVCLDDLAVFQSSDVQAHPDTHSLNPAVLEIITDSLLLAYPHREAERMKEENPNSNRAEHGREKGWKDRKLK